MRTTDTESRGVRGADQAYCGRSVTQPHEAHTPVLADEALELLAPRPGDWVVDATLGGGGHACRFGSAIGSTGRLHGFEVDAAALELAFNRLADCPCEVVLHQRNFAELGQVLEESNVAGVDVIFADLGLSSMQLADPQRGFSFSIDGPLDMRMDRRQRRQAADLVNRLSERELADLIYRYSQERFSRRIAARICKERRGGRITGTARLAELVCKAVGADPASRRAKIHPATRTFQALRIAVNDELAALEALLAQAPRCLKPGGRIGVISFHSLEDGLVKRDFRRRKEEGLYEIVTRRPVVPGPQERRANPRARSAKLRVAQRTGQGPD